jgi:hypothetical protein
MYCSERTSSKIFGVYALLWPKPVSGINVSGSTPQSLFKGIQMLFLLHDPYFSQLAKNILPYLGSC